MRRARTAPAIGSMACWAAVAVLGAAAAVSCSRPVAGDAPARPPGGAGAPAWIVAAASSTSLLTLDGVSPPRLVAAAWPPAGDRCVGVVVLEIRVDEEGWVRQSRVLRSLGAPCDERAAGYVDGWRFDPAVFWHLPRRTARGGGVVPAGGRAVPVLMTVAVPFPGESS